MKRRHLWIWISALAIVLGFVYYRTLLPTIGSTGDTAKFDFVGYVLGTPHAPGYPTYIVVNHLFTKYYPFGGLAHKANLLSAIFSVIASIFLFLILLLLDIKPRIAFCTALTFGFTRTLWSQSIVAEVYTLNILFLAMTVYFLLKWNQTKKTMHL